MTLSLGDMSRLNRETGNWMRMLLGTLAAVVLTAAVGCMEATPVPDTTPRFSGSVADQSYTEGEPITALTLPSASGGEGTLTYSLKPTVPGLTFNQATRVLNGTPTTDGTYSMSYTVEDGDTNTAASDADVLTFHHHRAASGHAIRGLLGKRGDLARIEGLQRTSAGWIRPRRLRNGLPLAGRRHHRGVAGNDEGGRTGLYALLLHRIRYHAERDRCD